jgi:hypothetical protein
LSVIGPVFQPDKLFLTTGRDFKWAYQLVDAAGVPVDFPAGKLYFEFFTCDDVPAVWDFVIDGSVASIKVEHEIADNIPNRTKFQLVFLHESEPAGGDPISLGSVQRQGC